MEITVKLFVNNGVRACKHSTSPYNQFLADMQEVVPAINSRCYFSNSNQSYLQIEDASGAEEDWIKDYNVLQYNGMFDRKNKSEIIFPYNNEGE